MKKGFVSFAVTMAFAVPSMAGTLNCSKIVPKSIEGQLPFPPVPMKIMEHRAIAGGSACEMIVRIPRGQSYQFLPIYVLKDKSVVLGTRFKNKVNTVRDKIASLYSQSKKKLFASVKDELNDIVIAIYKPKNAKKGRVLYAFVDPLCPFCHMSEPHLKSLADEYGYTVEIIPFIVHGKPAYQDTENFICNNKAYDDWIHNEYGKNKKCDRAEKILSKAQSIDTKLQLQGTPTFITNRGTFVIGANLKRLENVMRKGE